MKIQTIEVFVFKYDHHYRIGGHNDAPNRLAGTDYYFEPQWQHVYSRQTESCLVKITTDEGIEGWGEAQAPVVPEVPATLIARLMGPAIIGMDALDTDAVYERLYHLNHVRGHTASFTIDALAALDIALWDIKGKAAGKAVSQLLGQPKSLLPLYVSGLRRSSREERKMLAKEVVAEGYSGVKLFFGNTAEETLQECAAIRESIGGNALLAFDAICRHNFQSALQIGRGLDELNAAWFESPLDPEDVLAHAKLAQSIHTPLAVGEPLRTVREFEPWLQQKAMKIAQPDIVRCGITGGLRIIDAAQKDGLQVAPHIGICTAIGMAATWHVSAVLDDALPQEHQLDMFPVANKILAEPLDVKSGWAVVPRSPGLGIGVNEEFVRSHSADHWRMDAKGIVYRSGNL
ncbi:MAG: mandelate racemase/muconate lactonizing enzyme family protein [Flavisolibacter sp.]